MSEYTENLKDPRWQKVRLKVMERDDFCCVGCGDSTTTLSVHHDEYCDGEPWNTPLEKLRTLCENCHAIETARSLVKWCRDNGYKVGVRRLYQLRLEDVPEHKKNKIAGLIKRHKGAFVGALIEAGEPINDVMYNTNSGEPE